MTLTMTSLAGILLLTAAGAPSMRTRQSVPGPRTRTYFIAADEVSWDYVPGGREEIVGAPYTDTAFFDRHGLATLAEPLADEEGVALSTVAAALAGASRLRIARRDRCLAAA